MLHDYVKGEAEETKRNLEMCVRKGFHDDTKVIEDYTELLKMVSGYIRFLEGKTKQ